MKLVLDLLGPPRLMGARQRVELRAGSLSVGRSPEADWTISDTDRLISRLHLRVDASHGAFVLTDTSANGVYVNGSDEPVGYGASVSLRDGDRLRIGEAQIAVTVEAGQPAAGAPTAGAAAGGRFALDADAFAAQIAAPAASRDPFGGPFGGSIGGPIGVPIGSPSGTAGPGAGLSAPLPAAALPAAPAPAARGLIDANWMNEPVAAPAEAPFAPRQESRQENRQEGYQDNHQDRAASVVLPLRPGVPALGEAGPADPAPHLRAVPGPQAPSLVALVEARPDLSARRLAAALDAALDAAGPALGPQVRQELHEKISILLTKTPI
ncbi:FHA domain-containing protein [Methylobacterium sp. NEAU 140]|uniref:FHA domain-containing protein n=1 Tax=Methylobacterium sp. NEAU 140 TaxID=3064945 RepID=UPI002736FF56|nr:FHA domain-containing protein [Methylobacterium sp. NEAU 140]MDP4025133.1 FHA domain-containing protein [Methylobacterium sp. NEAU 140]